MAAPAYQAQGGSESVVNSTTLALNKPTGLATGNLMIAHLVISAGTTATITAPSGWTELLTIDELGDPALSLWAKIATADDAAAAEFTWTFGSPADATGNITRYTADSPYDLSRIQATGAFEDFDNNTYSIPGITPASGGGTYLILASQDETSTISVSNYAMATNNPAVWTEVYDASLLPHIAMAYASRTATTATGNISVSYSTGAQNRSLALVYLPGLIEVLPTVVSLATTLYTPTIPNVVINDPLAITATLPAPTVSGTTNPITNLAKNPASFTNLPKT